MFTGLLVFVIGITFFIGSYYIPLLENQALQSSLVLTVVIIPAAILGAIFYYRKSNPTYCLLLGLILFLIAGILDTLITVPVFIIQESGNHFDFFINLWFWSIGLKYVLSVWIYSILRPKQTISM
ncbi:DUF5367 family protein [uncultured Kordia sp.]|uniref:DUF5367 family protein n=1 Tax=uncultured Kordia sp. TaxID=507699 RepID=UPI00344DF5EA